MRKLLILFAMVVLLFNGKTLYAADFGIRGGVNLSSLPSTQGLRLNAPGQFSHYFEALEDAYTGFHFGIFLNINVSQLFLRTELLYTETGRSMVVASDMDRYPDVIFQTLNPTYSHLTLPLILGRHVGPFKVGAGPVASVLLDNTWSSVYLSDIDKDAYFDYRETTIGFQIMGGLQIGRVLMDVKYEHNLSRFGEGITIGGEFFEFHTRPRQFIFSLGLILF